MWLHAQLCLVIAKFMVTSRDGIMDYKIGAWIGYVVVSNIYVPTSSMHLCENVEQ